MYAAISVGVSEDNRGRLKQKIERTRLGGPIGINRRCLAQRVICGKTV